MAGLINPKNAVDHEQLSPLVPISPGTKEPFLKGWPTLTEEELEEAWEQNPEANTALRLDNYLALDPDNETAVEFLDELEKQGILPVTVKHRTWRDYPVRLYKAVPGLNYTEIERNGMELELRTGNTHLCLIPESTVKGEPYSWENDPCDKEVAELPQEALDIILGPEREIRRPPRLSLVDKAIPEGRRNSTLTSYAGMMRAKGMGQEAIEAAIWAENCQKCDPPLPEEDVATIARSVSRYEPVEPALPRLRIVSADEALSSSNSGRIQEVIGKGILPKGGTLILCGPSKVGKSLLTLEMAIRLAHGLDLWGLPVVRPWRVLIVQAEISQVYVHKRIRNILGGLGLEKAGNLLLDEEGCRFNLGYASHVQMLEEEVKKAEAEVVILDPLASYHIKDENDNIAMRSILERLSDISRKTGVAWVVVHHHGKPGMGGVTNYRGASSIKDCCDTLIDMRAVNSGSERTQVRLVFHEPRNGPKQPAILLERDENLRHHPVEVGKAPSSKVVTALREMGGGDQKKADLAKYLVGKAECSKSTAYSAIDKAVTCGAISEEGSGSQKVYSLKQD